MITLTRTQAADAAAWLREQADNADGAEHAVLLHYAGKLDEIARGAWSNPATARKDGLTTTVIENTPAGLTGVRWFRVQVSGHVRPGIVPGYNGIEYFEVSIRSDGRASTERTNTGRGYYPDLKPLRAAAIRAARKVAGGGA